MKADHDPSQIADKADALRQVNQIWAAKVAEGADPAVLVDLSEFADHDAAALSRQLGSQATSAGRRV